MAKTTKNLLILIAGVIIISLLGGGALYFYLNKKKVKIPQKTKPPEITISKNDLSKIYRLMASGDIKNKTEKKQVELLKKRLYKDCLAKERYVKDFLLKNKNSNILKEMKNIPLSEEYAFLPIYSKNKKISITPSGSLSFECLNLSGEEFEKCQKEKNGLIINQKNAEDNLDTTTHQGYLGEEIIGNYLRCKAVEANNENYCSQIGLYGYFFNKDEANRLSLKEGYIYDCKKYSYKANFILTTQLKKNYNCQNLCAKDAKSLGAEKECQVFCEAIKENDIKKCEGTSHSKYFINPSFLCKAIVSLDESYCQDIKPNIVYDVFFKDKGMERVTSIKYWNECQGKINGINRRDSYRWKNCRNNDIIKIEKISQKDACSEELNVYKGVRNRDYLLLKNVAQNGYNVEELANLLLGVLKAGKICDEKFHKEYIDYCKLKYK